MRFVANRLAERQLAHTTEMAAILYDIASDVDAEARRIVGRVSRRVRDNIDHRVGLDERGELIGRVNSNHWTAWFVEAGTLHQAPTAYLRKALDRKLPNARRGA